MLQKYLALQEEHYALKEICTEQERTLEELGGQLSTAKLAAVELREAADNAHQQQNQQQQEGAATWANDRLVTQCKSCNREFNITRRKVIKLFNCPYAFYLDSAISFVSIYSVVVVIVLVVVHWRRARIALLKGRAPSSLNRSIILATLKITGSTVQISPRALSAQPVRITMRANMFSNQADTVERFYSWRSYASPLDLCSSRRLEDPNRVHQPRRTLMHDSSVIRDNTVYRAVLRLAITSGPDPRLLVVRAQSFLPSCLPRPTGNWRDFGVDFWLDFICIQRVVYR